MTKPVPHNEREAWCEIWHAALQCFKLNGKPHPKLQLMRALHYRTHSPAGGKSHAATDYYAASTRGYAPRSELARNKLRMYARWGRD